jgi:hypothetical protein
MACRVPPALRARDRGIPVHHPKAVKFSFRGIYRAHARRNERLSAASHDTATVQALSEVAG